METGENEGMNRLEPRFSTTIAAVAAFVVGVLWPQLAHADGLGPGGYQSLMLLFLVALIVVVLTAVGVIALIVWLIFRRRSRR